MCGEHGFVYRSEDTATGSSPHVRGALLDEYAVLGVGGIIPACAGSTWLTRIGCRYSRDHPRMCGEHSAGLDQADCRLGSSPHVRGAQHSRSPRQRVPGIIPACAGSTILRPIV